MFDAVFEAVLKRFHDPKEKMRELAVNLMLEYVLIESRYDSDAVIFDQASTFVFSR